MGFDSSLNHIFFIILDSRRINEIYAPTRLLMQIRRSSILALSRSIYSGQTKEPEKQGCEFNSEVHNETARYYIHQQALG